MGLRHILAEHSRLSVQKYVVLQAVNATMECGERWHPDAWVMQASGVSHRLNVCNCSKHIEARFVESVFG